MSAKEARMLRVAVGSFLDFLILRLVTDTIREFGTEQSYYRVHAL